MASEISNEGQSDQYVTQAEQFWGQSDKTIKSAISALEFIEKSINLNPLNFRAWADKGFLLKQLGELDNALLCLERSIRLNGTFITSWYNKGVILGLVGRFEEAVNCYNEVLKLDPEHEFAKRDRDVLLNMVKKS